MVLNMLAETMPRSACQKRSACQSTSNSRRTGRQGQAWHSHGGRMLAIGSLQRPCHGYQHLFATRVYTKERVVIDVWWYKNLNFDSGWRGCATSAKCQNRFRVFAGFHQFPSFLKLGNLETTKPIAKLWFNQCFSRVT
jgi:hypothetical protein